jgi:hypothetical protein
MNPGLVVADSARKHETSRTRTWSMRSSDPVRVWKMDEGMEMFIGANRAGALLEVGVVYADDSTQVIVHAMSARLKFRR